MSRIRVPLAVDVQVGLDVGPVRLPARAVVMVAACCPPAFVILQLGIPFSARIGIAATLIVTGIGLGTPTREGIWIVAYWLDRLAARWMPSQLHQGRWSRGPVEITETGTLAAAGRPLARPRPARLATWVQPPRCTEIDTGLLHIDTVGWRGVARLEPPPVAIGSATYARWCDAVVRWLAAAECPVQVITRIRHADTAEAEVAWDAALRFEPRTGPLVTCQRAFVGEMAAHSLALRHHVIFAPHSTTADGVPAHWSPMGPTSPSQTTRIEAERSLDSALRLAQDAGVVAAPATAGQITADLLAHSVLRADEAAVVPAGAWVDGVHVGVLTMTGLPPDVDDGVVVDALQRAGVTGTVSLHLLPVRRETVRRALRRQHASLQRALRDCAGAVDAEVALADVQRLQADIAAGTTAVLRMALTVALHARSLSACREAVERAQAVLAGHGIGTVRPTVPGLLPLLSASPGMPPLRRSLRLTTDAVAARLLPALGTPFADIGAPLLGRNLRTGASVYLSAFAQPNHNMLVAGTSGAGKSVAAKTLLAGHCLQGVGAVVLDPDSEYEPLITLLGGRYYELAEVAINPLGVGEGRSCDEAAETIVCALSVMAGDAVEYRAGRPIRRLPAEDKAWLHRELVAFLDTWRAAESEPVLSDLVAWLDDVVHQQPDLSDVERQRYRRIALRLAVYTQGLLGSVFDRRSTFRLDPGIPVGVGLRGLSLRYAADLTPAMVVVLSHVLDLLDRATGPLIVLLDEAHVATSDPDAGQVLDQVVRRARKRSAGVWMPSQRIEEFVSTDLGLTLASTAAIKVLLGQEDSVAERVRQLFDLDADEAAALTPPVCGRGVVIAGAERAIVDVTPGPALWPWVRGDGLGSGEGDAA